MQKENVIPSNNIPPFFIIIIIINIFLHQHHCFCCHHQHPIVKNQKTLTAEILNSASFLELQKGEDCFFFFRWNLETHNLHGYNNLNTQTRRVFFRSEDSPSFSTSVSYHSATLVPVVPCGWLFAVGVWVCQEYLRMECLFHVYKEKTNVYCIFNNVTKWDHNRIF